jgi:hypothetical protein
MRKVPEPEDAFVTRVEDLKTRAIPASEIAAAITVHERLRTAQAICHSLVPGGYSESAMLALFTALSAQAEATRADAAGQA